MNDKQNDILSVAESLFETKGFDGTSVRDIAKQAGVNVAMISYYFGSKAQLLETLFTHRLENFKVDQDLIFGDKLTAFETLESLVTSLVTVMNRNAGVYKILSVERGIRMRLVNSDSYAKVKMYNLDLITKAIQKGVDAGVFNKAISPVLIHATLMGTFMNFQMNRAFLQSVLAIENDEKYNHYIENQLAKHIHLTIKALLTYED